jgi:hypothetical protein
MYTVTAANLTDVRNSEIISIKRKVPAIIAGGKRAQKWIIREYNNYLVAFFILTIYIEAFEGDWAS